MPPLPMKPCNKPGCRQLTREKYCHLHADEDRRRDRMRGTRQERGYTNEWLKAAKAHLRENPLCVICQNEGRTTAATEVDHITPHKGDMTIFWDKSQWQSLCRPCHSSKTAREDGGFGNKGNGRGKVSPSCGTDGVPVDPKHHWR